MNGIGLANDFMVVVGRKNFFLQIGVFKFETFTQTINLGQGSVEFFLGDFTFGNVTENNHRTNDKPVVANGGRGIFDADRFAVAAPEDFVVNAPYDAFAEGIVNRALFGVIRFAIDVRMVNDRMNFPANQSIGRPAQHAFRRRVHKGCYSVTVDAVNTFASRPENQLVFAFDFTKEPFRAAPFRNPFA